MDYYEFWRFIMAAVVVIAAVFVGTQIGIYLVLREIKRALTPPPSVPPKGGKERESNVL